MATRINIKPSKTYATAVNAEKAIAAIPLFNENPQLRYLIVQNEEGRYYPVFMGQYAVECGVHFHFCVAG